MQTIKRSWIEAWTNIGIGYGINFVANILILPLFGFKITVKDNLILGVIYTIISLLRQFMIRRFFNKSDDKMGIKNIKEIS